MKALVVADNELAVSNISTVLKAAGYDVIIYKWLLKALDNVEEIGPHLVVISTEEYPRHWKTMTQFCQTNFSDYTPQVILFTGKDWNAEEEKKANALGVRGTFDSVDVEGLDNLREILKTKIDIYSGNLTVEKDAFTGIVEEEPVVEETASIEEAITEDDLKIIEEPVYTTCSLIFTNPFTGAIVNGYARNFDGNTLEYVFDSKDCIKDLNEGTEIPFVTMKVESDIKSVKARVLSFDDSQIVLEIKQPA